MAAVIFQYYAAEDAYVFLEQTEALFSSIFRLLDIAQPPVKETLIVTVGRLGRYVVSTTEMKDVERSRLQYYESGRLVQNRVLSYFSTWQAKPDFKGYGVYAGERPPELLC